MKLFEQVRFIRANRLSAMADMAGCLLAFAPVPAFADVLEIGPRGDTRWIAGPLAANPSAAADETAVPDVFAAVALVPQGAIFEAQQARLIPAVYAAKVEELAARYDLSPSLIEALVWQESRWRADAVSPVGARGLTQLMPGTARELGVDSADPLANLEGGARYLRAQADRFGGDIEKALAAYNAGPARVNSAGGVPAIRETQNYVASVMGRLSNQARSPQ